MKKRIIGISLAICVGLISPIFAAGTSFSDVPKTHWAYSYVETASQNGWVAGVGDGTFGVNNQVTYTQLATMLVQAFFSDELNAYQGPSDTWYTAFCNVANEAGLFDGTAADGQIQNDSVVNQPVTRYDMAQMMYNVLVAEKAVPRHDAAAVRAGIADWSSIPAKYQNAVLGSVAAGIISGVDANGTFAGSGLMTRGQAAVVMTQVNGVVSAPRPESTLYSVTRVIDGDTIEVDYNGTLEKVRLIGVDTPESVHPDSSKNTEEGILASDYTKAKLEGKQVELEFDVQQRDQYGRLLAYVWVDGLMYNKTLLEDGVANLATYPPNVKYVDEFTAIVQAREPQTTPDTGTQDGQEPDQSRTVYITPTGKRYHYDNHCNGGTYIESTLDEALARGLTPCQKCAGG